MDKQSNIVPGETENCRICLSKLSENREEHHEEESITGDHSK